MYVLIVCLYQSGSMKLSDDLPFQVVVMIINYQQYRRIQAPGWTLGWTWAKKEVIWTMMGGQTTEQKGD